MMKKRMILTLVFLATLCISTQTSGALACSLAGRSLKAFDSDEFIFTGRVIEVVGAFRSDKFEGEAWGVKVEIEDAIHLPEKSVSARFEIVRYELRADCAYMGTSGKKVSEFYPVGTKVKVIAKRARLLAQRTDGGELRLEILPGSLGDISRNTYADGSSMTNAQIVFDYRTHRRATAEERTENLMPFLDSRSALPEFELRKDLLRLRDAKTVATRLNVLERLVYYSGGNVDYEHLVSKHVARRRTRNSLINQKRAYEKKQSNRR